MTTERYTHHPSLTAAIRSWYADTVEGYVDPAGPFDDLEREGCESGMVPGLVYTVDAHQFYTDHVDEIGDLVADREQEIGGPLRSDACDRRTLFAWFAFEETARRMRDELVAEQ